MSVRFEDSSATGELDWLPGGRRTVHAEFSDGARGTLWSYYTDELGYEESELLGLTERAAWDQHHARDVMHLNSPS